MKKEINKIVFVDLDGTVINTINGNPFPKGVWDLKINFELLDAIKKLKPDYICIVTNQGGIEKGFINESHFLNKIKYICSCIEEYISSKDNKINCYFQYCKSNDKTNDCRKPNTGMLENFLNELNNNDNHLGINCIMIGDASGLEGQFSDSDKKCAEQIDIPYYDVNFFIDKMNENHNFY